MLRSRADSLGIAPIDRRKDGCTLGDVIQIQLKTNNGVRTPSSRTLQTAFRGDAGF